MTPLFASWCLLPLAATFAVAENINVTLLSSAGLQSVHVRNRSLLYNYPLDPKTLGKLPRGGKNVAQGRSGFDLDSDDIAELYADSALLDPYVCRVKLGGAYANCHVASSDYTVKLEVMKHHYGSLPEVSLPDGAGSCISSRSKRAIGIVAVVDSCFVPLFYTRRPYQMYNVKGQLRYIVQDPPLYKQCVREAVCTAKSLVCRALIFALNIPACLPEICLQTLLAFDPLDPDAGLFADTFPTKCGCDCFGDSPDFRPVGPRRKPVPRLPDPVPHFPDEDDGGGGFDDGVRVPGEGGGGFEDDEDFYPARRYPGNGKSRIPTYTEAFKPFRDAARRRGSKRKRPAALPSVYFPSELGVEYTDSTLAK